MNIVLHKAQVAPACLPVGRRPTGPNCQLVLRDQNAPAIRLAQSDTNRRVGQILDNEFARRSHIQGREARAELLRAQRRATPTHRPAAAKYVGTHSNEPAISHRSSARQCYRAIRSAVPPELALQTSDPAAAQTETLGLADRVSAQISQSDGTVHNAHRRKDTPRAACLAPPEKHSTSLQHCFASRAVAGAVPLHAQPNR